MQDSKEISHKQQKLNKNLRHRPIAILPKGPSKFLDSSQEESVEIINPLSANVCNSVIVFNRRKNSNKSGHYHLDAGKSSIGNDRSGTKYCNVIHPSNQKEVASRLICETQNKACIICQFSECKRSFETITALRHHIKHFHTPRLKRMQHLSHSSNNLKQAVNHSPIERKLLSIRSNFENSNFITRNDATVKNVGSGLFPNSNSSSSSISEEYPIIHTANPKVSKWSKRKEVVLNLKKPFICPHSGCLKAY